MKYDGKYVFSEADIQNATWFQRPLDIYDLDKTYIESDVPIDFNEYVIRFRSGNYLRSNIHLQQSNH